MSHRGQNRERTHRSAYHWLGGNTCHDARDARPSLASGLADAAATHAAQTGGASQPLIPPAGRQGLTLAIITAASAQQTTIRDASGRTVGTVTTDSNGNKTFRDGAGRTTGTATIDSNGTTTFRDASGRTTGTASRARR
jgi:hypothetical protein